MKKKTSRFAAGLFCSLLLAGCVLPGGRPTEAVQMMQQLEQQSELVGQSLLAESSCPVSIADLSARNSADPLAYLCMSQQRLGDAVSAQAPAAAVTVSDPCPPDAHIYRVEAGDRLIELAKVIARPGEDWRAWSAGLHLRNRNCFDDAGGLRAGCELIVPAVGGHSTAEDFAILWKQRMKLDEDALLHLCERLWSPASE